MFKRKKGSEWEPGLLLNEGRLGILDRYGKLVDGCWDAKKTFGLCLDLSHLLGTGRPDEATVSKA